MLLGEIEIVQPLWKAVWELLKNLEIELHTYSDYVLNKKHQNDSSNQSVSKGKSI